MDFHSIQAEKAKAMMRYRRIRNIAKMWRLLEVIVALALLSWSSTRLPVAIKFTGHGFGQLYVYLFNPHINFVIGNTIIVVLFLLSRQNQTGNTAGAGGFYDEYVQNGEDQQTIIAYDSDGLNAIPPPQTKEKFLVTEETETEDKRIVVVENAVTKEECEAVSTAIQQARKQIQRFERTQSEKLKRDLRAKPLRQLRRSETDINPRAVVPCGHERAIPSIDMVDTLSSEEFRRTIEDFIAKQQRSLLAQNLAEKYQ